jgi:uncharacterized RDD family membrane protein YckC
MAGQSIPAGGAQAPALEVHTTGRRVLATLIDAILFTIVAIVLGILFGTASAGGGEASVTLSGVSSLLMLVFVFAYYIVLEGTRGQTVGKMVCGIRVVSEATGQPPGMGAATLRTLLRIVDGFLGYLVAFVVVLVSDKRQRLGDMVAKTLVVRT